VLWLVDVLWLVETDWLWLLDTNWLFPGGIFVEMKIMFGVPIGIEYDPSPHTVIENSV